MVTCYYQTKIGRIKIAQEGDAIVEINVSESEKESEKETPLIKKTIKELEEYFEGKRKFFDIPISIKGTEFQEKVWEALLRIPYGETKSYEDIAKMIGCPKGARAVGMANHNNKIIIIIPCHRVIGKNGKLIGYAGGLPVKEKLLQIESNYKLK